ncbi:hypothetical protein DAI22_02g225500 [Oryza sativa Japonica Group]|nr:hypothetical protein DAI22_02g225500 [Oryza sativa Japonica Group]
MTRTAAEMLTAVSSARTHRLDGIMGSDLREIRMRATKKSKKLQEAELSMPLFL